LAKKYHPDICKEKDAQDKFLEIQQAYEVRFMSHVKERGLLTIIFVRFCRMKKRELLLTALVTVVKTSHKVVCRPLSDLYFPFSNMYSLM
jgi:hypothetical protein